MAKKNPKESKKIPIQIENPKTAKVPSVTKSTTCDITDCKEPVAHSVTKDTVLHQLSELGLTFSTAKGAKKLALCKKHYKGVTKLKNKEEKMFRPSLFGKNAKTPKNTGLGKGMGGQLE
jgi:hypothetical protein